jgi:hypothetical protein
MLEHLEHFFTSMSGFLGASVDFASCCKARLHKLTNPIHVTFPIT